MQDLKPAYKRILLKLSGEALMGDDQFGINHERFSHNYQGLNVGLTGVEKAEVVAVVLPVGVPS